MESSMFPIRCLSGEWRELVPDRRSFREAILVVLHDLQLSRAAAAGEIQRCSTIAYTGVVMMVAGSLTTGLAIYKPVQLAWITWLLGGYEAARFEHFLLTIGYVLFLVVHIAQVIKAGWNNFRAMVTGFEVVEGAQTSAASPPLAVRQSSRSR